MNTDEMIKDIQRTLEMAMCDELPFVDACEMGAKALYNTGCRKVGKDEQVVNTKHLYNTLNSTLESGKRMGSETGVDETSKEILQELYNTPLEHHKDRIAFLAWKFGVQLEDRHEQKRLKEMVDRIPCGYVQKEEVDYWKNRCKELGEVASKRYILNFKGFSDTPEMLFGKRELADE